MPTGRVKWFDAKKGYGFILRPGDKDLFVHYTGIEMDGYKTLNEGQEVDYEITDSDKGPIAVNVRAAD